MTTTRKVLVTPEMALYLLKINTRNRPLRQSRVLYFVNQMVTGLWKFNGEAIIIGKGNILLDGQHRLAAIVKSNMPQMMIIVEGIDPSTFDTIDTGFARTNADILATEGVKNYTMVSSNISSYIGFCRNLTNTNTLKKSINLTKQEILAENNKCPEFWQDVATKAKTLDRTLKLIKGSVLGGYIAFLTKEKKHSIEKVYSFFEQLHSGANIENETILLLREKLLKDLTGQYKMTPTYKHALIVKTWNAFVSGKELKQMRYNQENEHMPKFM